MEYRSDNKQSLETLRKDLNLMLKLIKLSMGERSEMANKYKSLNMGLSKLLDVREKRNILSEKENKTFIEYTDLLKIRNDLYNKWENEYESLGLNLYKNAKTRINNIIALFVSFYTLFPPMRLEPTHLVIVNSEDEMNDHDASIFIKNKNNIFVQYKLKKKGHKPIKFNLNDKIIKSFSKSNVNTLIKDIIESINLYPRKYLFINSNNEPYTEKALQKILYELIPDKKLGVNVMRSSYVSYWFDKLNKLQLERVAFLMRTSIANMQTYYLKKDVAYLDEDIQIEEPKIIQKPSNTPLILNLPKENQRNVKLTDEQRDEKHENKKVYLNDYYALKRDILLERAKINSKQKYGQRLVRELNNNQLQIENLFQKTINKWGISYDDKLKKYVSKV